MIFLANAIREPFVCRIFIGRFIGGIACGAATVIVPMYVSEIAESKIRGSLGTLFQLQITLGILFAYLTGELKSDGELPAIDFPIFPHFHAISIVFLDQVFAHFSRANESGSSFVLSWISFLIKGQFMCKRFTWCLH